MDRLGVTLVEPPDWSCCGSTPAHASTEVLAAALAARNLAIVERMGRRYPRRPLPLLPSAFKKAHEKMAKNGVFRQTR